MASINQARILAIIEGGGKPLTVSEIHTIFGGLQSSVYVTIDKLNQRGWIDRGYGTGDNGRLAYRYSLTAAGRAELAAARALIEPVPS